MPNTPVREFRTIVADSGDPGYSNRIMVAHPVTGLLRVEWVQSRYGQIIPVNWGQVTMLQFLQEGYFPLRYLVADAQNMIVQTAVEKDFEWLLLWEHDVIAPADATYRLNDYIRDATIPVVSGLYYTRSRPSDPLIFRGRGTGAFTDWKPGDKVWCDGVPTGFLLIHMSILRAMYAESPEYQIPYGNRPVTRRVFRDPRDIWVDPMTGNTNSLTGTSDLEWCSRIMNEGYFAKAGWKAYQKKKYPFLCDTGIFCRHINPDGEQFP